MGSVIDPDSEEATANAARIMACVNACDGIDDPSLLPLVMSSLEVRAEKAEQRLEEALGALRSVEAHLWEKPHVTGGDRLICKLIHSILENAKGK